MQRLGGKWSLKCKRPFEELRFDSQTRVLIVNSGVEGIFCAGADLKERAGMQQDEVRRFVFSLRSMFDALERQPVPTIAAVEGAALGGGAELALACDFRVAGPKASFALPETGLAIIPGAGGTQRLPRLIGSSRAKDLIFTGRKVQPEEAMSLGLINRIAGHGQCQEEDTGSKAAIAFAKQMLSKGPIGMRMAKTAIDDGMQVDRATGMKIEEHCYAQTVPTKDRVEALTAFREKRKPQFTGE